MNVLIARRFADDGTRRRRGAAARASSPRAPTREPASTTPLLRDKLRRILEAEDLIDGSHDSKAAIALFDSYPKGELFGAPSEDLRAQIVGAAGAAGRRGAPARPPRLATAAAPRWSPRCRASATAPRCASACAAIVAERLRRPTHVEQHEVFGEDDRVYLHLTVALGGGAARRRRRRRSSAA